MKIIKTLLALALAFVLCFQLWQSVYSWWRDISYSFSDHTRAEMIVKTYADEHGLSYGDYPQSLIELLDRNPETITFVTEYPTKKDASPEIDLSEYALSDTVPLFMQWDQRWGYIPYGSDVAGITGCGPVCLSMAGFYVTKDEAFSPDRIIEFALRNGYYVPGTGSSWTLISEGGEKLGLEVTELPLDESRMLRELNAGNPIICVMGPGDFTTTGHYIVLTGVTDGKFRVNDPNSCENSEKLWSYSEIRDQIRNLWSIEAG